MNHDQMVARLKVAYRAKRNREDTMEMIGIYYDAGRELDIPKDILRRSLAPTFQEKMDRFTAEINNSLLYMWGGIGLALLLILIRNW